MHSRRCLWFSLLLAACGSDDGAARDAGAADAAASCVARDVPVAACPARGVYSEPVAIELAALDSQWPIYYTTDGSEPDPEGGTLYTGPFVVQGEPGRAVVAVRARAFPAGRGPSRIATHSYVFPEFVLSQPSDPPGLPVQWGVADPIAADYQMDPDVLGDPAIIAEAVAALSSLPSLAIVMETDDLFGTEAGIYMFPEQEGIEWERPVSAELIYAGGPSLQADCGLRIQGGSSTRDGKAAKLSMRLLFKGTYGPTKLEWPLFGSAAETRFDTLVLDAHLNFTFIHPDHGQRIRSQFLRDGYVSALLGATSTPAPRGRFVHLFLDGLYWGIYDLHERPDAAFAAHYLGGDKDEYDVLRHTKGEFIQGDSTAWNEMFQIARGDLADPANYQALQQYLDIADFIDYMLVNFYAGNDDWPHHNWYAARRRVEGAGFRFFSWDAEHVLKNIDVDRTGVNDADSPGELYQLLLASSDFRARVAARADELLGPGGALSPENAAALYNARAEEIRGAVLLESARWGDNRRAGEPYTRDDWQAELTWLRDEYFPQRTAVVKDQLSSLSAGSSE